MCRQRVKVSNQMKYLGVILDTGVTFIPHIRSVVNKAENTLRSLHSLMRNTSGPSEKKRRMYVTVVNSIILYAAPVWATEINSNKKRILINKLHRLEAIRIIRAYRTVSYDAATILAGICPIDITAKSYSIQYNEIKRIIERNGYITTEVRNEIKNNTTDWSTDAWKLRIADRQLPGGNSVKEVLLPIFDLWIKRRNMPLSHEITQIITGHGCFGQYLYRFRRRDIATCVYCNNNREDNHHVLTECPEWAIQREELVDKLQIVDTNLETVVRAAMDGEDKWMALKEFCKVIMMQKITTE